MRPIGERAEGADDFGASMFSTSAPVVRPRGPAGQGGVPPLHLLEDPDFLPRSTYSRGGVPERAPFMPDSDEEEDDVFPTFEEEEAAAAAAGGGREYYEEDFEEEEPEVPQRAARGGYAAASATGQRRPSRRQSLEMSTPSPAPAPVPKHAASTGGRVRGSFALAQIAAARSATAGPAGRPGGMAGRGAGKARASAGGGVAPSKGTRKTIFPERDEVLAAEAREAAVRERQAQLAEMNPLVYGKGARRVDYEPKGIAEYRAVRAAEGEGKYWKLGTLGKNTDDPELAAKHMKKQAAKEYARQVEEENRARLANLEPAAQKTSPRVKEPTARERAREFAKNVPKPVSKREVAIRKLRARGAREVTDATNFFEDNSADQYRIDAGNDDGWGFNDGPQMPRVQMSELDQLTAKHNAAKSQVDAIRKEFARL